MSDDPERFDRAVRELALEDGVEIVLSIPGVWEAVSEYYNNAAIDRMRDEADEPESEVEVEILTQPEPPTAQMRRPPFQDEADTDDGTRTERAERRATEKPD